MTPCLSEVFSCHTDTKVSRIDAEWLMVPGGSQPCVLSGCGTNSSSFLTSVLSLRSCKHHLTE